MYGTDMASVFFLSCTCEQAETNQQGPGVRVRGPFLSFISYALASPHVPRDNVDVWALSAVKQWTGIELSATEETPIALVLGPQRP